MAQLAQQLLASAEALRQNPFSPTVQQTIRRLISDGVLPPKGAELAQWKQWLERFPASLVHHDTAAVAIAACVGVGAGVADSGIHKRIRTALSWFPNLKGADVPELASRSLHVRDGLDRIVGNSPKMREVRAHGWSSAFGEDLRNALGLKTMLQTTPVLILGETGTGKELVAQSVCRAAPGTWDSNKGWIPGKTDSVNLAALPRELIYSALFGHEKGAFTGATTAVKGILENCHGGAVFLDEVADSPLPAQVALLRALQEGRARPLGSNKDVDAAPRVISATHRDLLHLCKQRVFRADLYHRLSSVILELPPLRERLEDIELIAASFIDDLEYELQPIIKERFAEFLRNKASEHKWPGNVRELLAAVRALCLGLPPRLMTSLESKDGPVPSAMLDREWTLEEAKRWYAAYVVAGCPIKKDAAKRLDIDRGTLRTLLQKEEL